MVYGQRNGVGLLASGTKAVRREVAMDRLCSRKGSSKDSKILYTDRIKVSAIFSVLIHPFKMYSQEDTRGLWGTWMGVWSSFVLGV